MKMRPTVGKANKTQIGKNLKSIKGAVMSKLKGKKGC